MIEPSAIEAAEATEITEILKPAEPEQRVSVREIFANPNFRYLWAGESISLLGDQFNMIALPWLVLQLTGDAFAVGTVMALANIPRAVFMLVGGAMIDRFSARKVMLVSNIVRMIAVAILAALVLSESIELWMLYGYALVFGLADAFYFPAQASILPQVVKLEHLELGNSITQGTAQISFAVGPVLAGVLIASLGGGSHVVDGETIPGMTGIGVAFAIDTITFLLSVLTLILMKVHLPASDGETKEGMFQSIKAGLQFVWERKTLRSIFLLVAGINFLVNGPFLVGIPYLADNRFPEGAAAYGFIMGGYGGGMLLGIMLAAMLPKLSPERMGTVLLLVISTLGIGIALTGITYSAAIATLLSLGMGVANGYVVILFITWLQTRVAENMLGRAMSLLMFASFGLQPVSSVLAGFFTELNATVFFVVAGSLMTLMTLWAGSQPSIRNMGLEPQTRTVTREELGEIGDL